MQVCNDPTARESAVFDEVAWGSGWQEQNFEATDDPIVAGGLTIADFNGDGVLEIFIPQQGEDQLYVRQSDGQYLNEASSRLPGALAVPTTSGTAFDADGDGDLDLLISRRMGGHTLLVNAGDGYFSDGTVAAGLAETAHPAVGATIADFDRDGDLDIFVITYRHCETSMGSDPENPYSDGPQALWQNQGDGTFVDVSDSMPGHPGIDARLRAAAWFDADDNGTPDLYTISDKGVSSTCMEPNQLFFNNDAGFEEAAVTVSLAIANEGMGLALGDLNGDGYPEIALSDMSRTWVMESDGLGGWYDASAVRGLGINTSTDGRWSGWGTVFADFNNDARLDLFMGFGGLADVPSSTMNPWSQPDALWLQNEAGGFAQVADDWGVEGVGSTRAVIATDMNGDGWLDLATREIGGTAVVWLARCGQASWLQVDLKQNSANPQAIGATIDVKHGENSQRRWITLGASGLQSTAPVTAHFGLGLAENVDITVTWPDGTQSEFSGVDVNQTVKIVRED